MRGLLFGRVHTAVWWLISRVLWLTQPTFTVGISGVVLDSSGNILLLRHRFRQYGGWELPGGFLKRGERLAGALIRELHEETGLDVRVLRLLDSCVTRRHHLDLSYLAEITGGVLRIDSKEIIEAGFFAPHALPREMRAEVVRTIQLAGES
jgi:8-oxo-dGTP diphosphatase